MRHHHDLTEHRSWPRPLGCTAPPSCAVRKDGRVAMAGDGQVSLGQTVVIGQRRRSAASPRPCPGGFAAPRRMPSPYSNDWRRSERFPDQLGARLRRKLAKDWRTDRYLRRWRRCCGRRRAAHPPPQPAVSTARTRRCLTKKRGRDHRHTLVRQRTSTSPLPRDCTWAGCAPPLSLHPPPPPSLSHLPHPTPIRVTPPPPKGFSGGCDRARESVCEHDIHSHGDTRPALRLHNGKSCWRPSSSDEYVPSPRENRFSRVDRMTLDPPNTPPHPPPPPPETERRKRPPSASR
jgi:hypothetical protein